MAKPKKITCQTCKARKVRCDGGKPCCDRCRIGKRKCVYGQKRRPVTFRHSKLSSAVPPEASPVEFGHNSLRANQTDPSNRADRHTQHEHIELHQPELAENEVSLNQEAQDHTASIGSTPQFPLYEGITPSGFSHISANTPSIPVYYSVDQYPQIDRFEPQEASTTLSSTDGDLLHFYVCNIGPWLDVGSPERHYTYTIPRLARQHPILLYALLSCSARISRLQTKGRLDYPEAEDKYQHLCVQLLIPLLDDLAAVIQDEVVLAAIVILRMSEQYDEYHEDRQFHLVPGAFFHYKATGPSSTLNGGLAEALFYSYVKSDIRMAILGRCGTRLAMDSWPLDNVDPVSDADWTNRMTWLLVQTINLCYGTDNSGVLPGHLLESFIDEWKRNLPRTFQPYDAQEPDSESFPVIRLLCPWHIVGLQFYHASKILLAGHPDSTRSLTGALQFNRYLQSNILPHVKTLCAISFSNEHFGCRINASHLVAMGAQYLHGKEERLAVENYFTHLQEASGWPSQMCLDMIEKSYHEDIF